LLTNSGPPAHAERHIFHQIYIKGMTGKAKLCFKRLFSVLPRVYLSDLPGKNAVHGSLAVTHGHLPDSAPHGPLPVTPMLLPRTG